MLLVVTCIALFAGAPVAARGLTLFHPAVADAPLSGVVIAPGTAAFGNVKVGTKSPTLSFTATNYTNSTVGFISLSGSTAFNLQPGTCHLVSGEVMLAIGASCTFTAAFSPTALGSATATMNISTSSGPFSFQLSGNGVPAIAVFITPSSAVFGNVTVGTVSPTLSFTAINDTDSTIGYVSTVGSGEFRLAPGTCHLVKNEVMLAETSACIFTAAFAPTALGPATATINISTSSGPFTFQLTGTGVSALPVSKPGGPYTGLTSAPVSFTGSGSSAPFGQAITGYAWNFGDGTNGTGPSPTHTYTTMGTYNVTLTVTDTSGQTASATTSARISQAPNPLSIVAHVTPAPNSAGWNHTPVTVSFTCSSTGSPIVQCPVSQTFSTDVAGKIVSGTVTDVAGDSKTASATVNLEVTPPSLSVSSPSANSTVTLSTSSIGISGSVSSIAATIVSVTCNGTPATVSGTAFSCTAALKAGANPLPVVATDIAGNQTSASLNLTYVAAPSLQILSPANLGITNLTPVTVNGTVNDPNATVTLDGVAVAQSGGGFSTPVPLVEGLNILTAVATNTAGISTTATIELTLDTTPPHVQINSPANGSVLTASSVNVTGLANDVVVGTVNLQDLAVTVNGVAAQVANRSFSALNVPLALGANTIQAIGTDRAGNSATTSITVTRVLPSQTPAAAVGAAVLTQWVNIVSGDNQTAAVGTPLAAPVVVSLTDSTSHPLANKTVVFQVTANNGLVTAAGQAPSSAAAVTTDVNGQAQVTWTLGQRAGAGNNVLQVSSALAVSPVTFTATGTTGSAAMVVVDSGNNQTGVLGQPLPFPFVVDVVDAGHNRVPGVPIVFTVKKGGGNFAGSPTASVTSDSNGRAIAVLTAGLTEGINNNLVEANFAGNTFMPASFVATAKAPGNASATTISGLVLDNSNQPIPGVTIRLYKTNQGSGNNLPVQVGSSILTDATGSFVIASAPVGSFKLMADGSTATTASSYPTLEYDIVTVAGNDNTIGMPIYLPALDTVDKVCVDETHGGILTLPQYPGFALNIAAGSATFPGGSRTGCVSATPVNGDKVPMAPGFGQQPRFIVTIQPVGTMFNPPAAMSLPNVDGLAPKSVTEMYSYDHDLSMFVAIGTGTVSSDGSVITSDPGVGVVKAGWHCGGNPDTSGAAENVTVSVSQTSVTVGVGQKIDVTATGQPGPIGNPAYSWTSADSTIATAPYASGNTSQSDPNTASITGIAPGTTTITVTYQCQSGASATAQIMVTVVQVDSLQASLPSTKNVDTGTAPADGTFSTTNKMLVYAAPANDLMAALLNSGTVTVKAINIQPASAASSVLWAIQRNPDDTVAGGTPALSQTSGAQNTFSTSLAGNFAVIVYIDLNANGSYDPGEELRVLRVAVVQTTIQPGSFIKTAVVFTGGVAQLGTNQTMSIQGDFLLQGGGADQSIGVSQIVLGNAGNLRTDTFMVNYPVPAGNPPAPANVPGTETEIPGGPTPMLDSVNVPKGGQATGGNSPFRGNSSTTPQGAGPGGNGQIIRISSLDAPAFGWDQNHPVTTNPWATTQGGNAFRDFLVAYPQTFPNAYEALASGDWTVTATGNSNMGTWVNNGSTVTIPGAVMGSATLTTTGLPAPADSAGAQLLGPSFVHEYTLTHNP